MNNTVIKEKLVLKKCIRKKLYKCLFTIIVFLLGMIITKVNTSLKPILKKALYEDSISFMKNKNLYNKYFGKLIDTEKKEKEVIAEKMAYKNEEKTSTGVKLTVNDNYLVPCIEDGIVVFVGEKDGFQTVIIEQTDGIKTTYSNIKQNNYKLYDFLEKGEIIGEVINNVLYLSQEKEGEYIDYKKYI